MNKKSIGEALAPYARMIVAKGVTVGKLAFANCTYLTTAGVFTPTAGVVVAPSNGWRIGDNTRVQLFSTKLDQVGQGWTTGLTLSQTNSKFSNGQAPKNQVFIATHFGVNFAKLASGDTDPSTPQTKTPFTANGLNALLQNFSWDLTVGRGNTRTIGPLLSFPDVGGMYAESRVIGVAGASNGMPGCGPVKLPIPVIFPPQVPVEIEAKCGTGFDLWEENAGAVTPIELRAGFFGFLMTMPV